MKQNKFWIFFIITILIYAFIYVFSIFEISKIRKNVDGDTKVFVTEDFYNKISKMIPESMSNLEKNLLEKNLKELNRIINKNVALSFKHVYRNVPVFVNSHYSIKGEYTEIYMALQGDIGNSFRKILYEDTNFSDRLNSSITTIVKTVNLNIEIELDKSNKNLLNSTGLKGDEHELFKEIFELVHKDMSKRYDNAMIDILRLSGITAGAGAAVLAKTLSKKMATKMTAKLTTKAGLKYIGAGASGATGAAIGSVIPVYGTAIGGVIGATLGWFGIDKIILEVDKYYNKKEFAAEIKLLIKKEEEKIKLLVKERIISHIKSLLTKRRNALKNLMIKDIMIKEDIDMIKYKEKKK